MPEPPIVAGTDRRGRDRAVLGHANVSDWQPGSGWEHRRVDGSGAVDAAGTVLAAEPPTRPVLTFDAPERRSIVTFLVEPYRDIVRLTLTHEHLPTEADRQAISAGWPAVLANLKSLLETGDVPVGHARLTGQPLAGPARPVLDSGMAIELRPLRHADAEAHCAGEDEQTVRWLTREYGTLAGTRAHFDRLAANAAAGRGKRGFGVWWDDRLAGYVDCDPDLTDGLAPDERGAVNLAYCVHPWARGHGVAVAAVGLICEYVRDHGIGARAAIRVEPANTASVRVAHRCGFHHRRRYDTAHPDGAPATFDLYLRDVREARRPRSATPEIRDAREAPRPNSATSEKRDAREARRLRNATPE